MKDVYEMKYNEIVDRIAKDPTTKAMPGGGHTTQDKEFLSHVQISDDRFAGCFVTLNMQGISLAASMSGLGSVVAKIIDQMEESDEAMKDFVRSIEFYRKEPLR